MAEERLSVQELLERGLYHYGLGEIEKAITFWRQVLELDPSNETAREYIEIETGRQPESGRADDRPVIDLEDEVLDAELPAPPPIPEEFLAGQQYLAAGRAELAIESFEAAHRANPGNPLYFAHVELAKARLVKEVLNLIGGRRAVIKLRVPLDQLTGQERFTQEEGFVLSLITGDIGMEDLVALSPLPNFSTYRIVNRLLNDGLAVSLGEM